MSFVTNFFNSSGLPLSIDYTFMLFDEQSLLQAKNFETKEVRIIAYYTKKLLLTVVNTGLRENEYSPFFPSCSDL